MRWADFCPGRGGLGDRLALSQVRPFTEVKLVNSILILAIDITLIIASINVVVRVKPSGKR